MTWLNIKTINLMTCSTCLYKTMSSEKFSHTKMRWLVVLGYIFTLIHALQPNYEGYKVFRIHPRSEDDLNMLVTFTENPHFDFWSPLKLNGKPLCVMIHPKAQTNFLSLLREHGIYFYVFLDDVETAVEKEKMIQNALSLNRFAKYDRFDQIASYLNDLENKYPKTVKLKSVGKSVQKRKAKVCQISTDHDAKKPIIFITAGVYGREWFSVALAKYIIEELVEKQQNKYLMDKVDWHILPVMNPDGYEYSHTHERFWRKNRSVQNDSCIGVNLNRNFDFHWGEVTGSSYPCSDIYIGLKAFSESESKNIRDYFKRFKNRIKMFLNLHGYGPGIFYPWEYTKRPPVDGSKLHLLAEDASDAILDAGGDKFEVEPTVSVVAPAGGSSEDWAKGKEEIEYVFMMSLPTGDNSYDPNPKEIMRLSKTIFEGIKVFGKYINNDL